MHIFVHRQVCCCTGNLKKEYEEVKFFSSVSEISLFSELLSVLVIVFWAAGVFFLEIVGALDESLSVIDHLKLLGSYIFLFVLTIPSDKIVRGVREKRIIKLEKKIHHVQKHHPEQEYHLEFIDRTAYMHHNLVPWDYAVCFKLYICLFG